MAKVLTAKAIETMKPGPARREVPDGAARKLYFIVQPSGAKSWAYRYRKAGKPRKLTLGPYPEIGLKSARELAGKAALQIAGGADPGAEKKAAKLAARTPADRDLVEKVAAQFLSRHVKSLRPGTRVEVERVLNKEIIPAWRGRRLSQIGRADIHELLDSIVDRGAPISANRTLAWLKGMCNFAAARGLIEISPCTGIKPPGGQETARDRVLSDDELKAVWQAADALEAPYCGFVQLLILTGQRRNEISEMTWREIEADAKMWTLPAARTKNSIEHAIPLSDLAGEILKACPRIAGSDHVFTISGRRPIRGYHLIKRRLDALMPADTPAWVFHDLRRTVASGMARLGINLPVIEKLLNHVSGTFAGIVGVYQRHSFADEKRAAMQTWARHVEALVSASPATNIVELRRGA